jgi:hypothetical protein
MDLTKLPSYKAYGYADFLLKTMIQLMFEHPDWTVIEIKEVAEHMWEERQETAEDVLGSIYDPDEEAALFDREEAKQINRSR